MEYRYSINDAMQMAAKKVGIAGWEAYQWEAIGEDNLLRGCVPSGVYTRGPRKGRPKYRPPTPGTERTVVIAKVEMTSAAARYEADELKCWDCKGTGKEVARVSVAEGTTYRECRRCKGTGSPHNTEAKPTREAGSA